MVESKGYLLSSKYTLHHQLLCFWYLLLQTERNWDSSFTFITKAFAILMQINSKSKVTHNKLLEIGVYLCIQQLSYGIFCIFYFSFVLLHQYIFFCYFIYMYLFIYLFQVRQAEVCISHKTYSLMSEHSSSKHRCVRQNVNWLSRWPLPVRRACRVPSLSM